MSDDGFASPLLVSLIALAGLLCLATTDAANVLVARARAQTAADNAALAAAAAQWPLSDDDTDPSAVARSVAEANDAQLESCDCPRHSARAIVTVSRATHIRMLGVAPREVRATAVAEIDLGRLFRPSG